MHTRAKSLTTSLTVGIGLEWTRKHLGLSTIVPQGEYEENHLLRWGASCSAAYSSSTGNTNDLRKI